MSDLTPERWRRLESIYERASVLDRAERAAYLDDACAEDAELRARVERMLEAAGAIDGFLESAPRMPFGAPDSAVEIDRFRILDRIGTGGMGIVYRAERADGTFDQHVAVKVLKRGMDTDDIVRRFRLERQTLATLRHAHIAKLIDGGATADGRPYLVMEFVDGRPLDRYCREEGLDLRPRIELFDAICDAVAYAHRNLVVHRDLKPGNILVDAQGNPKLLDFGVAKVLDPSGPGASLAVTATGDRLLTPRYASPEQVRGEGITTATDVYALGVVLYELLADRSPYPVETASTASLERAICETQPVRPSAAVTADTPEQARRLRRRLRGDLDLIVLKAMRKEPERRYESVGALQEDLRRWLRGDTVAARPDSWSYRAARVS